MIEDKQWEKVAQIMEHELDRPFGVCDEMPEPQSLIETLVSWVLVLGFFVVVIRLTRAFLLMN